MLLGGLKPLAVLAFRRTARLMVEELTERLRADGYEGVGSAHHNFFENIDPHGTPPGTLICGEEEIMEQQVVTGIAFSKDEAQISVRPAQQSSVRKTSRSAMAG